MNSNISEKHLRQIITGAVSEVLDPENNFKKNDMEKCVEIGKKVVETLKELKIYEDGTVIIP